MFSREELMDFFGLALKAELESANQTIGALKLSLKQSESMIRELEHSYQDSQKVLESISNDLDEDLARRTWCDRFLIELPDDTPIAFRTNTSSHRKAILDQNCLNYDLTESKFFPSVEHWSLYWCLAHASLMASEAAQAAKDEDGISRAFLEELSRQSVISSKFKDSGNLQIGFNAIFEQSAPGMKEAVVGADILLIVTGTSLVPNGLARIFWIQAKKPKKDTDSPFKLSYDYRNNDGLQIEKLAAVNKPDRGSFGLYAQYSNKLPYIPAVSEHHLPWADNILVKDISDIGVRLPEYLVARMTNLKDVGAFESAEALLEYLNTVSDAKPLFVVRASTGGRQHKLGYGEKDLLSVVTEHYREQLGLNKSRKLKDDYSYGR